MADIKDNVKTVSYGELTFGIRITLSIIFFDLSLCASSFCMNSGPIRARPKVKCEFTGTSSDVCYTFIGDEAAPLS